MASDEKRTIQASGICTTRGVPFAPSKNGRPAPVKTHKQKVREEAEQAREQAEQRQQESMRQDVENAYREYLPGQERWRRYQRHLKRGAV